MWIRVAALVAALAGLAVARDQASPAKQASPTHGAKDRGRELVEDVCTYCHNLDRLQGKELTREEWRGLIKGMIFEGAPVTDQEFSIILDYLVKHHGRR